MDLGAGLERLASVVNKTFNNYELDEYSGAAQIVKQYYTLSYSDSNRVVDHMKTITMLLISGLKPGNKEQGYVLRKLMRIIFQLLKVTDTINQDKFLKMQKELFNYYCDTFFYKMIADYFIYAVNFENEIDLYLKMMSSVYKICKKYKININTVDKISGSTFNNIKSTYGISKDNIIVYLTQNANEC